MPEMISLALVPPVLSMHRNESFLALLPYRPNHAHRPTAIFYRRKSTKFEWRNKPTPKPGIPSQLHNDPYLRICSRA